MLVHETSYSSHTSNFTTSLKQQTAGKILSVFFLWIPTPSTRLKHGRPHICKKKGTRNDLALFPIDTIKTRLQSPKGFFPSGGFRGIYNGIGAAALGSAPGSALFFCFYERLKIVLAGNRDADGVVNERRKAIVHMTAASVGEAAACLIRVPTESVKQNMQIAQSSSSSGTASSVSSTLRMILAQKPSNRFVPSIFGACIVALV